MKKTTVLSLLVLVTVSLKSVQADMKWWDVNGSAAGSGQGTNAGVWDTTSLDWTTNSNGTSGTTTFSSNDVAVFSAGTDATNIFTIGTPNAVQASGIIIEEGTVQLGTVAAINIGANNVTVMPGAKLSIPDYTYLGGTNGTFYLGGTLENRTSIGTTRFVNGNMTITLINGGTLSYPTANTLTIVQIGPNNTSGTVISGTGPLTKIGAGVLAIATACTYTGGTIIQQGELRIRLSTDRLPITTDVTVTSPGILNLDGFNQQIGSLSGNGSVGTGPATLTIGGSINTVLNGAIVDFTNAGASGALGPGKLVKSGSGTIQFNGSNDISGGVTLTAGGIIVGSNGLLCGPASDLFISGGMLTLSNSLQTIEDLGGTGGTIYLGPGHTLVSIPTNSTNCGTLLTGPGNFTYAPTNSSYIQTLTGTTSLTGTITVQFGTVALSNAASIASISQLKLGAGSGLDTSALTSPNLWSANMTLEASGTGTDVGTDAAVLYAAPGSTIALNGNSITLDYDRIHPALYVAQGTLSLTSNHFTINSYYSLYPGTYTVAQQRTGTILTDGTFSVSGTAIPVGYEGFISSSGSNLVLTIGTPVTAPGNISSATLLTNKTVLLNFTNGSANHTYYVELNTNLAVTNWIPLSTNPTDSTGAFQFNDIASTNSSPRFYRTRAQ